MDSLEYIMSVVYVYCTDFVINLANLTGWSYYEVNFWIFCVLYPGALIGLGIVYFLQRVRMGRRSVQRDFGN